MFRACPSLRRLVGRHFSNAGLLFISVLVLLALVQLVLLMPKGAEVRMRQSQDAAAAAMTAAGRNRLAAASAALNASSPPPVPIPDSVADTDPDTKDGPVSASEADDDTIDLAKDFNFNIPDKKRPKTQESRLWQARSKRVVGALQHAWKGYKAHAWGFDELLPISRKGSNWFGLGLTIVDALDTAWILGDRSIFNEARDWVASHLDLAQSCDCNVFEVTIRVLGGLLSAHHLSGDKVLLDKAVDLADRLMVAFDSPTGIPYASVNLKERRALPSTQMGGASSIAEATTLQLEFKYLTMVTGNAKYWNAVQRAMAKVFDQKAVDGLVPIFVSPETGSFMTSEIRLGSRGDSYYEYLAKQWLQTNKTETAYLEAYRQSVNGIRKHLLGVSKPNELLYVGERVAGLSGPLSSKMDHLVCFLPGTLAIGATHGKRVSREERKRMPVRDRMDLDLAEELTRSCFEMYHQTVTGLAPEIVFWNAADTKLAARAPPPAAGGGLAQRDQQGPLTDILAYHQQTLDLGTPDRVAETIVRPYTPTTNAVPADDEAETDARVGRIPHFTHEQDFSIHTMDGHNLLRPETVESLFVMYRITGKRVYREWGWKIFRAFERWCRIEEGGYSSLSDVRQVPPEYRDKMETFFVGETLKYFYLLFADESHVPLTDYVFNTEAHPLPVFDLGATPQSRALKKELQWL
ncbi:glycoside hydrolase [Entophlyctis helioformis]|nr:glycoside hydrolase [Entophlyctis helioformis]